MLIGNHSKKSLWLRIRWRVLRHDTKSMINKTIKIYKVSFIRIKNVCSANDIVKKMKKASTD